MKKTIAILAALVMVFAVAAAALAEEPVTPTFMNGVQFNMDMEQVIELVNLSPYEIEREKTRGTTEFYELEYEDVVSDDGFIADIKFLFVDNGLVAIHYDFKDGTNYEDLKASLVELYGEAVPFDAAKIGNGRFVIDDDGKLDDCREMIEAEGFTFILEQDDDGDVDVTLMDPTAAYINN